MSGIRPLVVVALTTVAALSLMAALKAQASAEIRVLGQPVEGQLVHDIFGNTVGFEAFSDSRDRPD